MIIETIFAAMLGTSPTLAPPVSPWQRPVIELTKKDERIQVAAENPRRQYKRPPPSSSRSKGKKGRGQSDTPARFEDPRGGQHFDRGKRRY